MIAAIALGRGLIAERSAASRARAVVIVFVTAIVGGLWCSAASVQAALAREEARSIARHPVIAEEDGVDAPLQYLDRFDSIAGRQFEVRWLVMRDGAPLPPGVDRSIFEREGFVVSPALHDALEAAGSSRLTPHGLIGGAGLRNRDELIAYGRLPPDQRWVDAGTAVLAFGSRSGADPELPLFPLAVGLVAFLLLPGVILLVVGLGTRSSSQVYRCQLLHRLGVSRRRIALVGATESWMLSLGGASLGLLVHHAWSRSAAVLPVVGRRVFPGDLEIVWGARIAALLAVSGLGAVVGAFLALRRSRATWNARPIASDDEPHPIRLAPLAVGLAGLVAALAMAPSRSQSSLLMMAALVIVAAIPLALPMAAFVVGQALARRSSMTTWLAGRRMQHDPRGVMRPLLAAGAALTLLNVTVGYLAAVGYDDDPAPPRARMQAALVRHHPSGDGSDDDLRRLSGRGLLLVPFDESTLRIDAPCEEIAAVFGELAVTCSTDGQLGPSAKAELARALWLPEPVQGALHIGRVPPPASGRPAVAVALGTPRSGFAEEVRARVEGLGAPEVSERSELEHVPDNPLVRWLIAGLAVAASTAMAGLAILTVERYGRSVADHRILGILGIPARTHWLLEVGQFAICTVISIVAAYLAGALAAVVMTRAAGAPPPIGALRLVAAGALAALAASTFVVGVISKRRLASDGLHLAESGQARWTT